jgi:hypothetical protein
MLWLGMKIRHEPFSSALDGSEDLFVPIADPVGRRIRFNRGGELRIRSVRESENAQIAAGNLRS